MIQFGFGRYLSLGGRAAGTVGLACLLPLAALAESGVLKTRSGERLEGEIELDQGGLRVKQGEQAARIITGAELSWLRFQRLKLPEVTLADGEQRGVEVSRFPEEGFRGGAVASIEPQIQFPFQGGAASGSNDGAFSVRWEGQVVPVVEGLHRFILRGSGSASLWVHSQLLCHQVATNGPRQSSGEMYLDANERYNLILEWSQPAGGAMLHLDWEAEGLGTESIPASRLIHVPGNSSRSNLLHGLLGTYYGGADFSNPRLQRVDRELEFNWRKRGPYPESGVGERFSAVWTGRLVVPETSAFRFSIEAEGGVRLFVDGEKIYDRWEDLPDNAVSIATFPSIIESGKPHTVRVEYFNEVTRSRLKVGFYQDPKARPLKLSDCLTPDAPPERSEPLPAGGSEIPALRSVSVGVRLADGSMLGMLPNTASSTTFRFPTNGLVRQLPVDAVSRIQFAEVPADVAARFDPQRTGAWLHNGDFLEGDFQGMDEREIRLGSVLFGNRGVERDRVLALLLRPASSSSKPWVVLLHDGSTLRLEQLALEAGSVILKASPFNGQKVSLARISEIRYLP